MRRILEHFNDDPLLGFVAGDLAAEQRDEILALDADLNRRRLGISRAQTRHGFTPPGGHRQPLRGLETESVAVIEDGFDERLGDFRPVDTLRIVNDRIGRRGLLRPVGTRQPRSAAASKIQMVVSNGGWLPDTRLNGLFLYAPERDRKQRRR